MKKSCFCKSHPWWTVLIGIVLLIALLWIFKAPILGSYLSNKLKTKVSIGTFSLGRKELNIGNFRIKNPWGTKERYAFVSNQLDMQYDLSEMMASPSKIDKIALQDVFLYIECQNPLCSTNNWTYILQKIAGKEKEKHEVIVKKLTLANVNVTIRGLGMGLKGPSEKKMHFSHLEFNNISSKEGFPTQQLIFEIFRSAGLRDYIKAIFDTKGFFEEMFSPFRGMGENESLSEEKQEEFSI